MRGVDKEERRLCFIPLAQVGLGSAIRPASAGVALLPQVFNVGGVSHSVDTTVILQRPVYISSERAHAAVVRYLWI